MYGERVRAHGILHQPNTRNDGSSMVVLGSCVNNFMKLGPAPGVLSFPPCDGAARRCAFDMGPSWDFDTYAPLLFWPRKRNSGKLGHPHLFHLNPAKWRMWKTESGGDSLGMELLSRPTCEAKDP